MPPRKRFEHHVVSFSKLLDETGNQSEVVTIVGVAHDDELAFGRGDAAHQSGSVAALLDRNDTRAYGLGQGLRAIGAAVIGNDYFAGNSAAPQGSESLFNANFERLGLVQTRHHY